MNLLRLFTATVVIIAGAMASHSVLARSLGMLKICKKGEPEDYGEPSRASGKPCMDKTCWSDEVVVPAGAVFHDVGPIDDVGGPWIKLRIMTLGVVSIKGLEKCKVVSAAIPDDTPS